MFKLIGKKVITILRSNFLHNDTYMDADLGGEKLKPALIITKHNRPITINVDIN